MRPVVLCILDGWGLDPRARGQRRGAGATRRTSTGSGATCPHAQLAAHGPDVGLPEGQMGNSEVGHTNIGAGRVVWMDLPRIDNAIADGSFAANPALAGFAAALAGERRHRARRRARLARRRARPPAPHRRGGARDRRSGRAGGRARLPRRPRRAAAESAAGQIAALEADAAGGRAHRDRRRAASTRMDRDKRWERVALAVGRDPARRGLARARAPPRRSPPAYARGETDEFVTPTVIGDYAGAGDGDGLFFANFRADRARQILGGAGRSRSSTASRSAGGRRGRRCSAWWSTPTELDRLMPAMFPSEDIVEHARGLGRGAAA